MSRVLPTCLGLLAVLALDSPASAAEKSPGMGALESTAISSCDLLGYGTLTQTFTPPVAIPDNNQALVQVGSIPTVNDGGTIVDVVFDITIGHTWVGDLLARIEYGNCAGGPPTAASNVICRPRGTGASALSPCGSVSDFGCWADLGDAPTPNVEPTPLTYRFSDGAPAPMAEGTCPTKLAAGCYRPSSMGGSLAAFHLQHRGGCFRLLVGDYTPSDVGVVAAWAVHMSNDTPVAAHAASWGALKTIYR